MVVATTNDSPTAVILVGVKKTENTEANIMRNNTISILKYLNLNFRFSGVATEREENSPNNIANNMKEIIPKNKINALKGLILARVIETVLTALEKRNRNIDAIPIQNIIQNNFCALCCSSVIVFLLVLLLFFAI